MAKKKNGSKQEQPASILQEAGLQEEAWQVLDSNPLNPAQPRPGATPPSPNDMPPHFVGTLNPDMQHDKVFVGTQLASPRIVSTPLMPVGPAGNPQSNAAIRSIIKINQAAAAASTGGVNFRGPWLSFATYNVGDIVTYNSSSYIAITGSVNLVPWANSTNWTILGKNLNFRGLWASIQNVRQNGVNFSSNGSTTSFTFGSSILAGSFIIVNTFAKNIGSGAVPIVTDTQGNLYTLIVAGSRIDSNEYQMQTWIAPAKAGACTVNVAWSGGGPPGTGGLLASEITSLASNPVGASTHAEEKTGGALPMTLGVSTGQMIYTCATVDAASLTAPSGYASFTDVGNESSSAWQTAPMAGSNTITWVSTQTRFMATAVALMLNSSLAYNPYDVVEFNGSMWLCVAATSGSPISDPPSWVLFAQSTGFAQVKTVNYPAVSGDEGTLLSFAGPGASITLTLPATPPDSGWWVAVENVGPATLTVAPNGLTIDGSASSLSLNTNQGVLIFTDGTNYFTFRGFSSGVGGVNVQTISYAAIQGDSGKLISMNGSNLTLTLPSPPPTGTWMIFVQNLNSTNLTINRNGLTIDGAASNLTLGQNQGITIFTNGTNYFTLHGVNSITVPSFLTATAPDGSGNVVIASATVSPSFAVIGPTHCAGSGPLTARQIQGSDLVNLEITSASGNSVTTSQSGNLQLCGATLPAGLYRVSVYIVVTNSGAGNLSMTITWNDGTASQSYSPSNISTTVIGTIAQFDIVVLSDGAHDIAYSFSLI